jgi:2-polyprenyl-6-methoxyphenol hydroxylase-like FAD-dependent oxidoreductase
LAATQEQSRRKQEISERVVIVGGGVAGLGVALGLSRAGCEVVVVDRDPLLDTDTPDQAFALERRGAPQVRHTHALLARLTLALRDRYPDVLQILVAAGGIEVDLARRYEEPQEGDNLLRVLLARRTTLEWALRRVAWRQPHLTLRGGTGVDSLIGDRERVRGVHLESGETVEGGTVVAAGGRRAPVPAWLASLGVTVPEEVHDTGVAYLTRWYRSSELWDEVIGGEELVRLGGDLGYMFYLAVPADRGMFSLTMAIGANDDRLRTRLLVPDVFDRAASALPLPPGLVDGLVPYGPVHPMAGLINRIRRFVDPHGVPLVTGFHAVGEAHTCTNPIYGRGCSLGLVQANALADAFVAHRDDPFARVLAYEGACRDETEPWYDISVQSDEARRRRAQLQSDLADPTSEEPNLFDRLFQVGGDDPIVGRAVLRAINLLATPAQLLSDPVLVGRVMQLVADPDAARARANRWRRTGITRQQMLDLTAA